MTQPSSSIRTFALIAVASISAFIMVMAYRHTEILSAPDWCARAINAEKLTAGRSQSGIELCKDLLMKQVQSIATDAHIYAGSLALCLIVLMVIVIAGGKLSFTASKTGVSANVGKDAEQAAQQVADAATSEADAIKGDNG